MRYYVTANSRDDKISLLNTLTDILDPEPGSDYNILIKSEQFPEYLLSDARVRDVQPHPDDWPGYELKLFVE